MRTRPFGAAGVQVPLIGQGTWNIEQGDRAAAIKSLQHGLDLGLTHIDTAEMYGSGLAEEMVGQAIAGRRDEVFLVSKVLPQNASRLGTVTACERSLKRLGTDRLDCYLLHWPGSHPLADTIGAFEALRSSGKIRSWGVSNFDVSELEQAKKIAGAGAIACNQVLYHLRERTIENGVMTWCQKHKVAVVAYSPFGQGDFPDLGSAQGRVLSEIAKANGATARQVALAFLVREACLFAIPKAARSAHTKENAGVGDLELSPADIARIDQAFPRDPRSRGLPTL